VPFENFLLFGYQLIKMASELLAMDLMTSPFQASMPTQITRKNEI
jgi:hypothetical protein